MTDLDEYSSVPPKSTREVQTRYVYEGKGQPMPMELDEWS